MTGFSHPGRRGLERMQSANAGVHPDADLLTAFAEQSLSAREHEQVLAHLAACAQCRNVVVLAGSPLVEPVPEPVRQRALWEMPLFHWGTVAATAVVVVVAVSIGVHESRKSPTAAILNERPSTAQVASDKVVEEPRAKDAPHNVTTAAPPPIARVAPSPAKRAVHLQEQVRYERVPNPQEQRAEAKQLGPNAAGLLAENEDAAKPAAPSVPPPPPGVAVGGAMSRDALLTAQSAPLEKKDERADWNIIVAPQPNVAQQTAPSPETATAYPARQATNVTSQAEALNMNSAAMSGLAETPGVGSKPTRSGGSAKAKSAGKDLFSVNLLSSAETGTQWQITREGTLQRSFNVGGTWESMLPGHTFHSVAVVRDHIWAGGDDGLYFSSNNGHSWAPLVVRSGSTAARGGVVQLRFSDAQNGSLETSTGETWTTQDGGRSWNKQ